MKTNHGQVGEALCIKITQDKFEKLTGKRMPNGAFIHVDEFNKKYGVSTVPFQIDNEAQGDYECVCVYGVEVH